VTEAHEARLGATHAAAMASKKAQARSSGGVACRAPANRGGQVGILVAPLARQTQDALPVDAAYQDVVTPALERLQCKPPETTDPSFAWKRWELPIDGAEYCGRATHTCVTLLPCGSPCVVRVGRNGNCSFLVRMKRSFWENVNKAWGLTVEEAWSHHAFRCGLSHNAGVFLLRNARAYQLSAGSVHHPHALSVLCNMGRTGMLSKQVTGALVPPKEFGGGFELIALPPCPLVVEECFCLLGHKSTFSSPLVGDAGHAVDASVWGKLHGASIRSPQDAEKFQSAGRLISKHNVARTLRNMPTLNTHFAFSSQTVCVLNTGYAVCVEERARSLLAPSDEEDGADDDDDDDDDRGSSRATAVAEAEAAVDASDGDEEDEDEDEEEEGEEEEAPAPLPAEAKASPKDKNGKGVAARRRKDDDDGSEVDELQEESEQSDAPETSDNESSDDESSDDDSGDGGVIDSEEEEDEQPRKKRRKKETARSRSAAAAAAPAALPPPPPNVPNLAELKATAKVEVGTELNKSLKSIFVPTFGHVQRNLLQGPGAEKVGARRREQLQQELMEVQQSKCPDTMIAAWANVTRTLVDMQADPPADGMVLVGEAERKRVRALSEQTVGFAAATFADVDAAIAQSREQLRRLEMMRKRGYDVLEAVEGGCIAPIAAAAQAGASQG